ncbi:uncharacterized protein EAE98_004832 [Botrytis deweyae]|uniref:NAD(P)-binding protein n=1 Tax=Botrytis deweyae TaxID=2478750 RepID=A0ABQ7IPE8_9HELO|nr:uncharacterized protein EAE98_004832 [Botrytis deweyae]KAF7930432.1 hypothetical protein EAE98_004832 [Botrytis deweyae]
MAFTSMLTQYFPPAPLFTEKDLPSQKGKVFLVTGGNQGVGYELIKMLYPTDATIYMGSRSSSSAHTAIAEITACDPARAENLIFLPLDLMDFHSIRAAAEMFLAREEKLDVLWNNAGIGGLPPGTKTKQGIEGHMGVNVVGTYYFTRLLLGCLRRAVEGGVENSVRIVWTTSWMAEGKSPEGGVRMQDLERGGCGNEYVDYAVSRAAGWMMGVEAGKRWGGEGILSLIQNPGNLRTQAYRTQPPLTKFFINLLPHPAKLGAYTELFAGLSPLTSQDQGAYIIPWGRIQPRHRHPRADIYAAMDAGRGAEVWEWCERMIGSGAGGDV